MVKVNDVRELKAVAKCAAGRDDGVAKAHFAYLNAQVWCLGSRQSGESVA
jgi:hypothetical protein